MSTINDAQTYVDALVTELMTRGIWHPTAYFNVTANEQPTFNVDYYSIDPSSDEFRNHPRDFKVEGDEIHAAYEAALLWIRKIPTREDRERDYFLELLAKTTEYGRRVGIDDGFVNPLQVLAKKLSENAITGSK